MADREESCDNAFTVQNCVGCGKSAPETDTNYTLISAQFGWRLSRVKLGDGSTRLEWRCPTCWRDHKRSREGAAAADGEAEPTSAETDLLKRRGRTKP